MKYLKLIVFLFITGNQGVYAQNKIACKATNTNTAVSLVQKIGFGSCASQNKKQPALQAAVAADPDLFIWLGDNIYGDTKNMDVLRQKYSKLGCKSEFIELNKVAHFLATWDDHDYGVNDGGLEYPKKEESKEVFLDFWDEPKESERRKHTGIYHSLMYGPEGKRVQVILLDTRTFRTKLLPAKGAAYRNDYRPNRDEKATILGEQQWLWLKEQLLQPAEIRIIATSTQFGVGYNGYEAWANFPLEQQKMMSLIQNTKANGVVFISGDVHYAEVSKITPNGGYPLYDITSSGITQTWGHVETSSNRVGDAYRPNNFGMLEIDWTLDDPTLEFTIRSVEGEAVITQEMKLSELSF